MIKKKKNILVLSHAKVTQTETFIKAHLKNLNANIYHLYGWELDLKTKDDITLESLYLPKPKLWHKLESLLPYFIYFRLRHIKQKKHTKKALINRYIIDNEIEMILAEYGTTGSFIAPVCESLGLPLIVHFHGFDASRYDTLKRFKNGYQLMFKVAKHVIVVSRAMAKTLEQQGCPKNKLVLNTYGPHPDYTKVSVDYESNFLVAVGRQTYKKAPYLTILAFEKVLQQFPNLKLKMIGDGELFDVSQHLVKSLGLEDSVLLLGSLDRPEIIKHLQSSFAYLQHSVVAYNGDSEGTPVGIIEAMAAGLPVVSTRHAGIPDVVLEEETGYLVNENDIDQMAFYILKIVEDRNLARTMGQKGKARIENYYTLDKHLDTINQLINGSQS